MKSHRNVLTPANRPGNMDIVTTTTPHGDKQPLLKRVSKVIENTAIETIETISVAPLASEIEALKTGSTNVMSTFTGGDRASRVAALQAMSTAESLGDYLGERLTINNFVIQQIQMPDESTGEIVDVPRIILVGEEGKSYYAISQGIFSALKNIVGICGLPGNSEDWPIVVEPTEEKTRKGYKVFTLRIVG